jgi:acyl carrier protein
MTTENWTPLTKEQIEQRFIEMINDYLKLDLVYPLDPDMSLKDLKIANDPDLHQRLQEMDPEALEMLRSNYEVDSIDVLELVIQIEEEFGCTIDDSEIAKLLRWQDLIEYITDSQDPTKIKKK